MPYQKSEYAGDDVYKIDCTGDCVVGDKICFERALFSGSFKSPKFDGFEKVQGEIISDSYGSGKQQHTFTIQIENGEKTKIKGRNLYKNGAFRQPWVNEKEREAKLEEKHARGDAARAARDQRKEIDGWGR